MNFATKNLLACLCSASSTVETVSMIFTYLVNLYLQIQNPIHLISISTTYLESFGADLSENKLFQCVSILFTGTRTIWLNWHINTHEKKLQLTYINATLHLIYVNGFFTLPHDGISTLIITPQVVNMNSHWNKWSYLTNNSLMYNISSAWQLTVENNSMS